MKILPLLAVTAITATPLLAQETRHLDSHEHGVGQLDIAVDGQQIAMELHAPGADIVGFEYMAESAEDRVTVDAAIATLEGPLDLFVLPDAAGCSVIQAAAELETEDDHGDHDDHDEDHAEDEHADHAEEGHDDHAEEAGHTEFYAEYLLTCADPSAITEITFAYFDNFPNALEVEVQLISDNGATSFEVERDEPTLDLRGML